MKKALEFRSHELSHSHKEAKLKWMAQGMPTIASRLSSQMQQIQKTRREGLLLQLKGLRFLTRQGVAIRAYHESEGNLQQLLLTWSEMKMLKTGSKKTGLPVTSQSMNKFAF